MSSSAYAIFDPSRQLWLCLAVGGTLRWSTSQRDATKWAHRPHALEEMAERRKDDREFPEMAYVVQLAGVTMKKATAAAVTYSNSTRLI